MTISVIIRPVSSPLPPPSLVAANIIAQPGGQMAATPLPALRNIVTNCVAGAAVALQLLPQGEQRVFNRCGTGQALMVYPIVGMRIEGNGANVPVTIADGGEATFTWDQSITWLVS